MASLQKKPEESVLSKLSELRKVCDKAISVHRQNVDSTFESFGKFLESRRSKVQLTANNQVKLGKLKVQLRELEDELVRALAVKTRTEAKRIVVTDSLSDTRVKVDELQKIVQDQAAQKEEYAAILSEQSKTLAESEVKFLEANKTREEIEEAFRWYNRVLGFCISGGHGVTFKFTNINRKCPSEEYSFTVRHENEIYTLLDCNPRLNDIEELVHQLNKSNGLFRFVRIMRERFQGTSSGSIQHLIYEDPDCTSISLSAPISSVSTGSRSNSSLPLREANRDITKANHGIGTKLPNPFVSPRKSPRFVVKEHKES